jgi:hypothetical protein
MRPFIQCDARDRAGHPVLQELPDRLASVRIAQARHTRTRDPSPGATSNGVKSRTRPPRTGTVQRSADHQDPQPILSGVAGWKVIDHHSLRPPPGHMGKKGKAAGSEHWNEKRLLCSNLQGHGERPEKPAN